MNNLYVLINIDPDQMKTIQNGTFDFKSHGYPAPLKDDHIINVLFSKDLLFMNLSKQKQAELVNEALGKYKWCLQQNKKFDAVAFDIDLPERGKTTLQIEFRNNDAYSGLFIHIPKVINPSEIVYMRKEANADNPSSERGEE